METYLLYIVIGIAFYILTVQQLYRQRTALSKMSAMMMTMCVSMGSGILAGYFLTIMIEGDFFTFTLTGALTGGILGAIPGVSLGLLSILEGFFTGLMSGMMGAMIAIMISASQKMYLLHFFFVLFLISLSLALYVAAQQLDRPLPVFFKWVRHPFYPVMILIVGWMTLPFYAETDGSSIQSVQITAGEFTYAPNHIKAKRNKPITLILKNEGQQEHDLEIMNMKTATPSSANMDMVSHQHQKEHNVVHLHAKPGEQTSITFTPEKAGTYQWFCTIPGHKEAGMHGTIVVEG